MKRHHPFLALSLLLAAATTAQAAFKFVAWADNRPSLGTTTQQNFHWVVLEMNRILCPPSLPDQWPLFHIVPGDYDRTSQTNTELSSYSAFPTRHCAPGNHDDNIGSLSNRSMDYQNVRFIFLNEYVCPAGVDNNSQGRVCPHILSWLDGQLTNTPQFVFVIGHEPAFPQNRHVGTSLDLYPSDRDAFWNLINSRGVYAYLCGHTHFYSTYSNGAGPTVQIDVGNAGNPDDPKQTFVLFEVTDTGVSRHAYRGLYGQPFDGGTPGTPASNPSPADGAGSVTLDTLLSWTPGSGVQSHKVYLSTVSGNLGQTSTLIYAGSNSSCPAPGLAYGTTYYWRVDEVRWSGSIVAGATWSFTTRPPLSLTVTADGNGSASGSGTYDDGSLVPISATANANYHFANWTATGSVTVTNPLSADTTVTINGDGTVTAHFAINRHTLRTSSNDGGSVTTPGEGTTSYDYGTVVNLVATPDAHYHFVSWTGPVANSGAPATTVAITADMTVAAVFAINRHTLTTSSNDGGSVTAPGEGTTSYGYGTVVNLVATPDAHYHFVHWTGPVANAAAPATTVAITADTTVAAVFAIDRHTLTVTSGAKGSVSSPGAGVFTYDYGATVTLGATAEAHYHFTSWSGTAVVANKVANPAWGNTTVTVEGDYTLQANFAIDQHTLTVSAAPHGAVAAPGAGVFSYDYGTTVPIEAMAEAHYHFTGWSGTAAAASNVADAGDNSTTVRMEADYTLQAGFAIDQHALTIGSTPGGTVNDPGLGTFHYDYGRQILLEAQARPGFALTHWSGSYFGVANPVYFAVEADHRIQANFVSLRDTIHVAAHAPDDLEPNDPGGSDPAGDGSPEHPFDSIQEAIDVAGAGAEILVQAGLYRERLDLTGKTVILRGLWLSDPTQIGMPVLDGQGMGPVVQFGTGANSVLSGFRLQGGQARTGAAVLCTRARANLRNCLLVGNEVQRADGGVLNCQDSTVVLDNCTLSGNTGVPNAVVFAGSGGQVAASNSIIWGNTPLALTNMSEPVFSTTYCDVEGSWPGTENLDWDPLFATPGSDYHLQSRTGRWEPLTGTWLTDAQSSPCLDAGDPAGDYSSEPVPNGDRLNLGAYGGTTQASQSP